MTCFSTEARRPHINTHLCNRSNGRIRKPYSRRLWTAWSIVPRGLTFLWVWPLGDDSRRQRSRYSLLWVIPCLATYCRADSSTEDHSTYQAAFQERKFWKLLPVLLPSGLGVVKAFHNYCLALGCFLFPRWVSTMASSLNLPQSSVWACYLFPSETPIQSKNNHMKYVLIDNSYFGETFPYIRYSNKVFTFNSHLILTITLDGRYNHFYRLVN